MTNYSIPDSRALGKFPFLRQLRLQTLFARARPAYAYLLSLALLFSSLLWPFHAQAARRPQTSEPPDVLSANATITISPRTSTRIRLDAMRVDITLTQNDQGAWADVATWLRFQNPLTRTLTLDTVVEGADKTPRVDNLQLRAGGVAQALTADGEQRWRWATPLAGQTRLEAILTYRVALGRGAAARLRYEPMRAWGGIGSARMTVRFPEKPASDQLLYVQPGGYTQTEALFTWSYDNVQTIAPLDLAFVITPAWRQLLQLRQDAAAPGAIEAALALGRWYDRLAHIEAPQQAFFVRFYPQAIAVLDSAWRQAPERSEAALLLAELYQQQADRATTENEQIAYRTLAAEFLAAARLNGVADAERDAALASLYLQLARYAQQQSAWPLCAQFLNALSALPASAQAELPADQILALRQFVALELAAQQVTDGDLVAARKTVEQTWGETALAVPGARRATFNAQVADVALESQRQLITVTLPLRQAQAPGALDAVQSLVTDLGAEAGVRARIAADNAASILQMQIDFTQRAQLPAQRLRLAAHVADNPDLALLHALLASSTLSERETESFFWRTHELSEAIDLTQAQRIWMEQAARYHQAISALEPPPANSAPLTATLSLAAIQRRLWQEEASAWEALAQASEVRYRLTLESRIGANIAQTAVGGPEQPLTVNLAVRDYRPETIAAAAAGLLLLAVLTAWLWWRAS